MKTHQSKIAPASVGQVIDTAISLISRLTLTGHQTGMVTAYLVELKEVCDERMPNLMLDLNDGTEDTQE